MMKLVEEYAGVGDLTAKDGLIPQVRYRIARFQGFVEHSGCRFRACTGSKDPWTRQRTSSRSWANR